MLIFIDIEGYFIGSDTRTIVFGENTFKARFHGNFLMNWLTVVLLVLVSVSDNVLGNRNESMNIVVIDQQLKQTNRKLRKKMTEEKPRDQ